MNQHKQADLNGRHGEDVAAHFYEMQGFEILCERYKTAVGEVDLIAKKDDLLVAIEVKMRKNFDDAAYSLSKRQQERIFHAMGCFLQQHSMLSFSAIRFDVVLLDQSFNIQYIPNAWGHE